MTNYYKNITKLFSNYEADVSRLLEYSKEMIPWYYVEAGVISKFKLQPHTYVHPSRNDSS